MSQLQEAQLSGLEAQCAVARQISYVLSHPGMSEWLKNALRAALNRNPVEVLNDLEILSLILRQRAELMLTERTASPNPRSNG